MSQDWDFKTPEELALIVLEQNGVEQGVMFDRLMASIASSIDFYATQCALCRGDGENETETVLVSLETVH